MAELSSPLQIAGLLENEDTLKTGIYSIYSFKSEDMGGEIYIGFGIFYSSENDMGNPWLWDVKLLWEQGEITEDGEDFLASGWKLSEDRQQYENSQGEIIKVRNVPIGKNGELL